MEKYEKKTLLANQLDQHQNNAFIQFLRSTLSVSASSDGIELNDKINLYEDANQQYERRQTETLLWIRTENPRSLPVNTLRQSDFFSV